MLNIKKFKKGNYVDIYSALTNGGIFSALEDSCVSKMYLWCGLRLSGTAALAENIVVTFWFKKKIHCTILL